MSVLFLLVLIGISLSSALNVSVKNLPAVTSLRDNVNNVTGHADMYQAVVPFVVRKLGIIECNGLDHTFGNNFFERIMGPGADFGGNYLCAPTCRGECVPAQNLFGEAPSSIYKFGCRCSPDRCGPNGPLVEPLIRTQFSLVCVPDDRCTCESMGPPRQMRGYLCNWINLTTKLPIAFLEGTLINDGTPNRSPIRWCSCCPGGGSQIQPRSE